MVVQNSLIAGQISAPNEMPRLVTDDLDKLKDCDLVIEAFVH